MYIAQNSVQCMYSYSACDSVHVGYCTLHRTALQCMYRYSNMIISMLCAIHFVTAIQCMYSYCACDSVRAGCWTLQRTPLQCMHSYCELQSYDSVHAGCCTQCMYSYSPCCVLQLHRTAYTFYSQYANIHIIQVFLVYRRQYRRLFEIYNHLRGTVHASNLLYFSWKMNMTAFITSKPHGFNVKVKNLLPALKKKQLDNCF
jgi:hypothetical protein